MISDLRLNSHQNEVSKFVFVNVFEIITEIKSEVINLDVQTQI